jgi:uncharacterized BrkB/YihY/UPF0761 family membrane protein
MNGLSWQRVRSRLPAVKHVLQQRSQALVALGVFATVGTASSGMQAVRTALNRAYGIERGMSCHVDLRRRSERRIAPQGAQ